ncbi:hypothetical protein [Parasulfitobacter algicola]|uniref:Uncharacterized protein n=1 Tax=Parasulfitobacter algicola TaxID=2614809 RepID=A0ABX2IXX2_9RHOB|nr:hypothetical protein [Sulfitobacter algicola]NSX55028.1 hypothetical protein [Sulfitobacter algicola]
MIAKFSLPAMVRLMDRTLLPSAQSMTVGPVCINAEASVGIGDMDVGEARTIMAEIDAKSSALLAVLAIILAASAFIFSLSQTWVALLLMFAQVTTISISILYLLRCLIYEPAPQLRHVFEMEAVTHDHALQIEAIKQVHYFNRVIMQTVLTSVLFFTMSMLVGVDAMISGAE